MYMYKKEEREVAKQKTAKSKDGSSLRNSQGRRMILESIMMNCPSLISELEPDLRLGHNRKGTLTHRPYLSSGEEAKKLLLLYSTFHFILATISKIFIRDTRGED
jgi:hypothetical protein